jgi:hypothetical protein
LVLRSERTWSAEFSGNNPRPRHTGTESSLATRWVDCGDGWPSSGRADGSRLDGEAERHEVRDLVV